ncbi:SOS response-associated peptidase family protein [Sphingomonas baiyangensis]|uniref:SOS response-associated peptidase n=1 Tax=Sphingomonas baiyangensis TaxID=2572576 RepID=A0A4U1L3S7_9SPHN|nr:SOS response-associated peptidase family protein [Sphingomonas baiyangensis]TKD51561.1 SOS response-associated peptidase [Sphingomonas baiyangensis]
MTAKQAELAARYGVGAVYPEDATFPPPELLPDRDAWVIRQDAEGRRLDKMTWGFPRKVSGKRIDKVSGKPIMLDTKVTNVRNYTSPFWKSALADPARRCLVLFTSFSEYGPGPTGKRPLFWFDVPSRPIVSFAGVWRSTDSGAVFAFLTTEPNPLVAPIQTKAMPVLLDEGHEERWLTGSFDEVLTLVKPFPSQIMLVTQAENTRAKTGDADSEASSHNKPEQPSLNL